MKTRCFAATELGVGESVNLSVTPDLGSVAWRVEGESAFTYTGNLTNFIHGVRGTAGTETITLLFGEHMLSRTFQVIAPTGIVFATIQSTDSFPTGYVGADMILDPVVMGPTNVSFIGVQYKEAACVATNCTGYWATNAAPSHTNDSSWIQLNAKNSRADSPDHVAWSWEEPWSAMTVGSGHFEWNIPVKWRVGNSGPGHDLAVWTQTFDVDDEGTLTIQKFGKWVSRTIEDVRTHGGEEE